MNILIINPPASDNVKIVREGRCMQRQEAWGTSWAPLSLATIAAILRDDGFTVRISDCSNDEVSFDGLLDMIREFSPSIIVANTSTPSIVSDLKVAEIAKGSGENIKVVFFGIHVTALPEDTFALNASVSYIAVGEPEYTIRDFARAVRDGKQTESINGLAFRENGKITVNPKRGFIEDLDELPFPAWDLVNVNGYRLPITNRPFLLVLTGRGCPYPCMFCAASVFYGKKPRLRSADRIVDEIKYVKEKFGINDFLFWSENSISDRKHMIEISEKIKADVPGIKWVCNGRVDMIDDELIRAMKAAGCWMIGYGIEAGTDKMLGAMKKNIKISDIENAVKITKTSGVEVTGHVIVGYPGETRNDILETGSLLKKLDLDYIQVYCSVPFPGSPVYNIVKNNGWLASDDWAMFEQNFSVINTPYLSAKDVMALREQIVKDFYFNPKKMIKTVLKVRSPGEILALFRFAMSYFKSWITKK